MPPITITYTLHPSQPLPPALTQALASIRTHLPLRNLHWKPSSRTSIRTIQEVDVNLIELGDVGPSTAGRLGGSVMETPLVNLCLVVCEDSETYKNSTRSFIRDWLSLLSARRNAQAPLIVLVNPYSAAGSSGKTVFGRDKGVLGKLKTDFNTGKRDRCVQVNLAPEGKDDPAVWPEFLSKLKESIVTAFDEAVVEKEEEVKRGEAQRLMVGWNFCTWFLVKESLATSFESVGLDEDALVIYEELEATFFQILKEQNLSWFGKLGASSPRDDSIPVLDIRAKNYREMLQSSNISIFDFRIYVFARQAILLGKLGRITEIAKRGQWFVASLTRRLRESEPDLAEHFIESWTYTACMDIVQHCDEWSRIDRPNGDYSGLIAYESARSELLDIARVQVERIGVACGHLPDSYPFSPSTMIIPQSDDVLFETFDADDSEVPEAASTGTAPSRPRSTISNQHLLDAKSDPGRFRNLYLTLTKKAIQAYDACGKANSVIRLKADLVALALHSEEWGAAYDLSRNLAKDCAELLIWEPIAKFALEGALHAHRELSLKVDEEWTNLALAYLRVAAVDRDVGTAVELENVLETLQQIDAGLEVDEHKAFQVMMTNDLAREGEEPDLTQITLEVTNNLPVAIEIASLEIEFEADANRIAFVAPSSTTQPGPNAITATCSTSVAGMYTFRSVVLSLGSLSFRYFGDGVQAIRMQRPAGCPSAVLRMPNRIALDDEPQVVAEIHSNRCDMRDVQLHLISADPGVRYALDRATIDGDAVPHDGGLQIGDVASGGTVVINIPYTGISSGDHSKATIIIEYKSASTGQARTYTDTQRITMGLPLTVNVQDFFRPNCLLSHFTIASDGKETLRIGSVELRPPAHGYAVEACRKDWDRTEVVTPDDPLSCLYKIRHREDAAAAAANTVLRLVIQYMTIEEELQQASGEALQRCSRPVKRAVRKRLEDRDAWLEQYLAESDIAEVYDPAWRGTIDRGLNEEAGTLIESLHSRSIPLSWRTLEIPVEIPSRRLLTTVHLAHSSPNPSGQIYEGRAISLLVRFDTKFTWAGTESTIDGDKGNLRRMMFDTQPNPEDWIVLGKKKGYYLADGHTEQREIVIIPIHPGYLPFPSVSVTLLPASTSTSTEQPREADSQRPEEEQEQDRDLDLDLMCETYVSNAAECVRVLPAKGGVTTMVPLESAWEVEVERRI